MIALLLASCSLPPPPPVHDDSCACTVQPPGWMSRRDSIVEGAAIGLVSPFQDLFMAVEQVPRSEAGAVSLQFYLNTLHGLTPDATLHGDPTYFEISGTEGIWQDLSAEIEGMDIHKRWAVVDTGERVLIGQIWTEEDKWAAKEPTFDALLAGWTLDPVTEPLPFANAPKWIPQPTPLIEARAAHETQVKPFRYGTKPEVPPPGTGFELVKYASPVGELRAYQTLDPKDGRKRPAVIWIEGGFGGPSSAVYTDVSRDSYQTAADFVRAGLAVMAPSFRGELDNPGNVEQFYGEANDLLAAIDHVRALPWVDPDRIYVIGHSTGGTHALNAAVTTDKVRAIFSIGGRADLKAVADEGGYGNEPYDIENEREVALRSVGAWANHIAVPTWWFEGDGEYTLDGPAMAVEAQRRGKPMWHHIVPGVNHESILAPLKGILVKQILEDTGPEPAFHFTEKMLVEAVAKER